jgi:hypothetical protein
VKWGTGCGVSGRFCAEPERLLGGQPDDIEEDNARSAAAGTGGEIRQVEVVSQPETEENSGGKNLIGGSACIATAAPASYKKNLTFKNSYGRVILLFVND